MKYNKSLLPLFCIVFTFAYPTKKDFSEAFIQVAEVGNPTVVSIISEKVVETNFHQFFEPFDNRFPKEEFKGHTLGSGVIIDAEKGYIITNNHVIKDAEEIKVIMFDKRVATVDLGDSDKLNVGEWVVAIGSPFGLKLNHTVTAGIVSAIGRSSVISRNNFEDFIQHDAAINPGNSGGALFNLDGKLVGINTAIATGGYSRANAGIGFAIPINMVKRVIEDLISDGKVTRGWLGVSVQDIDEGMAKALKLKNRNGAIISQVMKNSPAKAAGVKEQDVIISVDGEKVNDSSNLKNLISSLRPNNKTKLIVVRDGKEKNIAVTLGTRPDQDELRRAYNYGTTGFDLRGLNVEYYEDNTQLQSSSPEGVVVVEVENNSIAEENNIRRGDIIIEMGKTNINDMTDYKSELETYKKGDTIMLRILRNNIPLYIAFEIE